MAEVVGRVVVQPEDDGPKQQWFSPVVLLLMDDGTVLWESTGN